MPDSFFERKRKRPSSTTKPSGTSSASSSKAPRSNGKVAARPSTSARRSRDEEEDEEEGDVGDAETMDLRHEYEGSVRSEDEDALETPAEARVRLARLYVDGMRRQDIDPNDADAAAADEANIAARLGASASAQGTHLHLRIAARLVAPAHETILAVRGHASSVTGALIAPRGDSLFTCAKDGAVLRWSLRDGTLVGKAGARERTTPALANAAAGLNGDVEMHDAKVAGGGRSGKSKRSGAARRRTRRSAGGMEANVELKSDQGHTDQLWAMALSDDGALLATGGADRRVGLWNVTSLAALAASSSSKLQNGEVVEQGTSSPASASTTKQVGMSWSAGLTGHKGAITSLSFRLGTTQLLSASTDRTLKLWDATQRSYIETLFGHQEPAQSVSSLRGELAASAGGRDRTVRWWKINEESQLVFRAGARSRVREVIEGGEWEKATAEEGEQIVEGSVDVVAMVDEHSFISGGDSGALSLWSLSKKKPVFTRAAAHGFDTLASGGTASGVAPSPRAITSLATLPYSDLFASGSWDGTVRLWAIDASLRTFKPLFNVPAPGFVNALQLVRPKLTPDAEKWRRRGGIGASAGRIISATSNGAIEEEAAAPSTSEDDDEEATPDFEPTRSSNSKAERSPLLVVALGREPRMGRWSKLGSNPGGQEGARNGALVVPLPFRA